MKITDKVSSFIGKLIIGSAIALLATSVANASWEYHGTPASSSSASSDSGSGSRSSSPSSDSCASSSTSSSSSASSGDIDEDLAKCKLYKSLAEKFHDLSQDNNDNNYKKYLYYTQESVSLCMENTPNP